MKQQFITAVAGAGLLLLEGCASKKVAAPLPPPTPFIQAQQIQTEDDKNIEALWKQGLEEPIFAIGHAQLRTAVHLFKEKKARNGVPPSDAEVDAHFSKLTGKEIKTDLMMSVVAFLAAKQFLNEAFRIFQDGKPAAESLIRLKSVEEWLEKAGFSKDNPEGYEYAIKKLGLDSVKQFDELVENLKALDRLQRQPKPKPSSPSYPGAIILAANQPEVFAFDSF